MNESFGVTVVKVHDDLDIAIRADVARIQLADISVRHFYFYAADKHVTDIVAFVEDRLRDVCLHLMKSLTAKYPVY